MTRLLTVAVVAAAAWAPPPAIETLPPHRPGRHLVGKELPDLGLGRWIPAAPDDGGERPRATLWRWWTDGCPFCRASLPAVETLRRTYEPRGLRVVAVYHPKPPHRVADGAVQAAAKALGYDGLIAVDEDWSALDRAFPAGEGREATSVTLLVDDRGVIRFVHPGPVYFPSGDPRHARENADYRLLERAVRALVDEPAAAGT